MKLLSTIFFVIIGLYTSVPSATANYRLYYVDGSHNVARIDVSEYGQPLGKAHRITTKGGYDGFSISTDEKHLVGFRRTGSSKEEDTGNEWIDWECFVEQTGTRAWRRQFTTLTLLEMPWADMSKQGGFFRLQNSAFEVSYDVYQFSTASKVAESSVMAVISPDERYLVSHYDGAKVIDTITGTHVLLPGSPSGAVWAGDSHNLAWEDPSQGVWVARVSTEGKTVELADQRQIFQGPVGLELGYQPGIGLWFAADGSGYYCSSDLKAAKKMDHIKTPKGYEIPYDELKKLRDCIPEEGSFSTDGKLLACSFKIGKDVTEIRVRDSKGKWHSIVTGSAPTWRGERLWSPWQSRP